MAKRGITGTFATRREAEMAVETLVQEYDVNRSDVLMRAEGEDNTSGTVASGADASERHRGSGAPGDPEGDVVRPEPEREAAAEGVRAGGIVVSAEVEEAVLERARDAFREYGATAV